jgi:hypothetical protein
MEYGTRPTGNEKPGELAIVSPVRRTGDWYEGSGATQMR